MQNEKCEKGWSVESCGVAGMLRLLIVGAAIIPSKAAYNQQKQLQSFNQVWVGYFNQTRISDKWAFWLDLQTRTKEDFLTNFYQSFIRPGVSYIVNEGFRATAGYAYVVTYPADNHPYVTQPEHRAWEQIQWQNKFTKIRTAQRLRLEERFRRKIKDSADLGNGYSFNYRARYNFNLFTPLTKKGFDPHGVLFVASDEILVNFGKQIVYNYFDQNRIFVGFAYEANRSDQLQIGYMNIFQQMSTGYQYKLTNAVRIFYFHNLDLRKK